MNFGGVHVLGVEAKLTQSVLTMLGFDAQSERITDLNGGLALTDRHGEVLALWPFVGLISHWNRKHAQAVFVPSINKKDPLHFKYGRTVFLGVGTDFSLFLRGVVSGAVYTSPGIKVEGLLSQTPKEKRRSQFRIKFTNLPLLYSRFERAELG